MNKQSEINSHVNAGISNYFLLTFCNTFSPPISLSHKYGEWGVAPRKRRQLQASKTGYSAIVIYTMAQSSLRSGESNWRIGVKITITFIIGLSENGESQARTMHTPGPFFFIQTTFIIPLVVSTSVTVNVSEWYKVKNQTCACREEGPISLSNLWESKLNRKSSQTSTTSSMTNKIRRIKIIRENL